MKDFSFTFFAWILTLPVLGAMICFGIFNTNLTPFVLNPFRDATLLPLYVPVMAALTFGFLFGALMTWAAGGRDRKERRDLRKQAKHQQKEIDELKEKLKRQSFYMPKSQPLISGNAYDYVG